MGIRPQWPGWRRAFSTLAGSDLSTRNLAFAVGLGALVAPTPLLGLHTWMAIGLAFLCRVNRLAAFLGSNIANPFTMAPLVWLDIVVGAWILGRSAPRWPGRDLDWDWVVDLYTEAWLGALILGPLFMVGSYFLTAWLLRRARRGRGGDSTAG